MRNPRQAAPPARGGAALGVRLKGALPLLATCLALVAADPAWSKARKAPPAPPPPPAEPASETLRQLAGWVVASGDNRGLPFAVIDKQTAEVAVFDADGQLRGAAPALIGSARGDASTPGVGDRELSDIAPEERTTPAGRFLAGYGPAWGGKKVLWVDYATAISLHPVVTANRKERRLQRLRSSTPEDNRITFGCINVSGVFYEDVVRKTFMGKSSVFYVLPESEPLEAVLPAFASYAGSTHLAATAATGVDAAGVDAVGQD